MGANPGQQAPEVEMPSWNVPERTAERIGTYKRGALATGWRKGRSRKLMLKQRNNIICATVKQNVPERTTLLSNQRKVRAERTRTFPERIGTYRENIKHAQKQVRTYRNFSGTYQNVPQNAKLMAERTRTYQNAIGFLQY